MLLLSSKRPVSYQIVGHDCCKSVAVYTHVSTHFVCWRIKTPFCLIFFYRLSLGQQSIRIFFSGVTSNRNSCIRFPPPFLNIAQIVWFLRACGDRFLRWREEEGKKKKIWSNTPQVCGLKIRQKCKIRPWCAVLLRDRVAARSPSKATSTTRRMFRTRGPGLPPNSAGPLLNCPSVLASSAHPPSPLSFLLLSVLHPNRL